MNCTARRRRSRCGYYQVTGKPLGITGEMGELEAAKLLGLKLAEARMPYYDAIRITDSGVERIQIKGRAVDPADRYRGRVSAIKCDGEFESVALVLLDRLTFDTIEIWEADRLAVADRLSAPGSISRNERNSLAISQFQVDRSKSLVAASAGRGRGMYQARYRRLCRRTTDAGRT